MSGLDVRVTFAIIIDVFFVMRCFAVFVIFAFLSVSCVGTSGEIEVIGVDLNSGREDVSIYDICESVELIPLRGECAISNISSTPELTAIHDNRIYILDEGRCILYAFLMDGSLLYQSSRLGRGPGEFTDGCSILVNKNHGTLDVLSSRGYVMRYSLDDLSFVEKVSFPENGPRALHAFAQVDDGYLLYSFSDKNHLFYYSEKANEISTIATDLPLWYYRDYLGYCSPFSFIHGGVKYVEGYDGAMYSVDVETASMRKMLEWDTGGKALVFSDIPKGKDAVEYAEFKVDGSRNRITSFFYVWESQSYFHACVIFNSKPYNILYRKKDGKTFFFDRTKEGVFLLGGVIYDNALYSFCNAADLGMGLSRDYYQNLDAESYFIRYKLK